MSDFERFSAKNMAMARAWELEEEEKKKQQNKRQFEPVKGICDKCKQENLLKPYRFRQTDRRDGVASFGTVVKNLCEQCAPKSRNSNETPAPSERQVKNLLKGAMRNLK
ncbi:MAG: hypothetical protein GX116_03860 [Fibrobacter sp.]|jgi:hypothetical protein|nr:hypothetical protein [Fibrobacter sp.]